MRRKLFKTGGGGKEKKKEVLLPSPPPLPKAGLSGALFPSVWTCKLFPHASPTALNFTPSLLPHRPLPTSTGEFEDHSATASDCTSNLRGSDAQLFGGGKLPDQLAEHHESNREAFLFVHLHLSLVLLFSAQSHSHW